MALLAKLACAVALAMISSATAIALQEEAATSEPELRTVRLPFEPQLDAPLRYRVTIGGAGTGAAERELIMTIRYSRAGEIEPYRMAVTYEVVGGLPRNDPLLVQLTRPIAFNMDSVSPPTFDGDEEEAAYLSASEAALGEMVRAMSGDARDAQALEATFAEVRALEPSQRINLLRHYIHPVVIWAGRELDVGLADEGGTTIDTRHSAVSVGAEWILERVEDGIAFIKVHRRVVPEEYERVRGEAGAPRDPEALRRALPAERRDSYQVSMRTGLLIRYESELVGPGGEEAVLHRPPPIRRIELISATAGRSCASRTAGAFEAGGFNPTRAG